MKFYKWLVAFAFLIPVGVSAQITEKELDKLIQKTCTTFEVPGISVGIVKDSKIIYAKGHGVRSLTNKKEMNKQTLVGIASNSKGFTCFALAMLVDQGKLDWDDRVRKYIPEFKMYEPYVTEAFTIRDLVTNRSGLGLGAGDLMFFPEGHNFDVDDVINNVQYLQPESSFRSQFKYNNIMYIIAGEVIKRVSGLSWEDFIEQHIMKPVGMASSKASYNRVADHSNIIGAHARADKTVIQIPHDWSTIANPAGGIVSNVSDMLTWATFLMNDAVTKNGNRLLSKEQMHQLWQLQTPLPISTNNDYHQHFFGYGLGWFVGDVKGGYKQVSHTGGLIGTVTQFTLIPELKLGIVVLTNQMNGHAFRTITNTIKDSYLGYPDRNWIEKLGDKNTKWLAKNDSIKEAIFSKINLMKKESCKPNFSNITGTYADRWFGNIIVLEKENELHIKCERSPRLFGKLLPYNATTYVAKWHDRSYAADVFVFFTFDEKGKAQSATMKHIAPITDFSFDFHDLRLKRI